jgi:drug/metabolite transporter (DMT)-like permease
MSAKKIVWVRREMRMIKLFALGLLSICIIFGALGQISMKTGMMQVQKIDSISDLLDLRIAISIFGNIYVIVGLMLYTISAFLWLGALSTLNVSLMYPMLSLGYVITAFFAFFFLGELIPAIRWIGISLVIIGCILIARS